MRKTLITLISLCSVLMLLAMTTASGAEQTSQPAHAKRLKVGIAVVEPFVFRVGDHYSGFSMDIWRDLARRLNLDYEYVLVDRKVDQIDSVRSGKVDVAISAIGMTAAREAVVDLTHPYYTCGLQIMVLPHRPHSFFEVLTPINMRPVLEILLLAFGLGILLANGLYLSERRHDAAFQQGYIHGMREAFWQIYRIVATGECGGESITGARRRIITLFTWFVGAAIIATYTATITSNLTQRDILSTINSPNDLRTKRVATGGNATAATYLRSNGFNFVQTNNLKEAIALLEEDKVDAVVYDSPVLRYYCAHEGKGKTIVVGPVFAHESLGIALPTDSKLRKRLDKAILEAYDDGTIETLENKWFKGPE